MNEWSTFPWFIVVVYLSKQVDVILVIIILVTFELADGCELSDLGYIVVSTV